MPRPQRFCQFLGAGAAIVFLVLGIKASLGGIPYRNVLNERTAFDILLVRYHTGIGISNLLRDPQIQRSSWINGINEQTCSVMRQDQHGVLIHFQLAFCDGMLTEALGETAGHILKRLIGSRAVVILDTEGVIVHVSVEIACQVIAVVGLPLQNALMPISCHTVSIIVADGYVPSKTNGSPLDWDSNVRIFPVF